MEKIDRYFDKAKKENEIIPLSDMDAIISFKKDVVQSHNLFYNLLHRREFLYPASAVVVVLIVSIVALLVFDRKSSNNEVFIPEEQKRVVQLVKNIYAHPKNSKITLSQFGSNANLEVRAIPIHLRTKFELPEKQLRLLGITFSDQLIRYEGNVIGKGYVSFSVEKTKSVSVSVDDVERTGVNQYIFYPWFLSDEDGSQSVRYRFDNEDALKMTNSFFFSVIDQLIPIQVTRPGFRKVIFWYSQTPELMSILESSAMILDNSARKDNDVDGKRKTVEIQIFPTITKGSVQIIAKVLKEQDLEISVLNASGGVMQVPVNNQTLKEGEHNFSMDLSNLNNGLYFVRIKSNPGLITIHRLLKE